MQGDVDRALKLTNASYPGVLKDNELLYFRLRRRKLVEMIRKVAETEHEDGYTKNNYSNGNHSVHDDDMDVDDPVNGAAGWVMDMEDEKTSLLKHVKNGFDAAVEYEPMDMEDEKTSRLKHVKNGLDAAVEYGLVDMEDEKTSRLKHVKNGLDAAVEYGKQLRVEFSSDTRPEIKKPLEEAFSLLAYTDPKSSVLAHLLDEDGRIADGEELNSAILGMLSMSSCDVSAD